ncbi:hypothetical protein PHJA_002049800 [Phtheirospermum japonicum]|uniref:Uncharacterized protein n=1 Tax=Phtheirospermum japonicum TaxID=374723 RepID=A0A830CJ84_9LAMI|nr:hypothetical protein PHJA_002049800 [Phtheirospermum japonicum]
MEHLKGQCHGNEKSAENNYEKGQSRFIYYRLRGFIMSLQLWFYEICENANGIACMPVGQLSIPRMLKWRSIACMSVMPVGQFSIPRMLKWRSIGEQKNKDIKSNFLSLPPSKFKNIIPSEEEKNILELSPFLKSRNQWLRSDVPPSSSAGSRPTEFT